MNNTNLLYELHDNLQNQEQELTFEQVIDQNENKILNLIYGLTGDYHLAQDLTQDTFLKAFQAKHTFQGKSKISTWLYRIAMNTTIDYQRKSSSQRELPTEVVQDSQATSSCGEPEGQCQKNAVRKMLFAAIANLPEQHKEVYVLREVNGCSTKDVAEILDCSVELVKWRLHKAKSLLRKTLQKVEDSQTGTFQITAQGLE